MQLVARFFNDVGVRVKLKQLETSTWLAKITGVQPFTQMLATFSPIGAGPSFMDWVYLRYHSLVPQDDEPRGRSSDPKLDDLLTTWRTDPGDKRPALQRAIWDHLRKNVYRITTIVPPHYRITQSYVHAGRQPVLLVPRLLLVRGQDGVADRQGAQPGSSTSSRSKRRRSRRWLAMRTYIARRVAAGTAGAVARVPADLLARAHPARRRRHHAARPGRRPDPGGPRRAPARSWASTAPSWPSTAPGSAASSRATSAAR